MNCAGMLQIGHGFTEQKYVLTCSLVSIYNNTEVLKLKISDL